MPLLTLMNAQAAFGLRPLLDHADFSLQARERVGLIGRNGTGKSTLLRILAGHSSLDDGTLARQQDISIAYVPQEPILDDESDIFACVSAGVAGAVLAREQLAAGGDAARLDALHERVEALDAWNWEQRVEQVLQQLRLPPQAKIRELSGGTRKRVALAQAFVAAPSVLLLDEPTNHLDLESIEWLEAYLLEFDGSLITVTHDRSFLDRVATRIVELDRGKLRSYPGNFAAYESRKEYELHQEVVAAAQADKLLAQEESWIRQGVEARRTRSRSRVNRLHLLRESRAQRREVLGRVKLDVSAGVASGKIVADLEGVTKRFDGRAVIQNFTTTVLRGDKVGLVAPNGAGKTTLLKLMLGELSPDAGTVRRGTQLQVAYFDQMRAGLDLDATLEEFISPGSEWIEIGKQRKHVRSYLADFLFPAARARAPVRSLSGGERNRLLLARLFARPANVLVLDEPTNDLDIETLELLEELLQEYQGTLFLVSHDRRFLDNVVTSVIAFEGEGVWREYEGNVQDWLTQSARTRAAASRQQPAAAQAASPAHGGSHQSAMAHAPRKKLSYKDQRELEAIPATVASLEQEQAQLASALEAGGGAIFGDDPPRAAQMAARHAQIEEELLSLLERWELLENLRTG